MQLGIQHRAGHQLQELKCLFWECRRKFLKIQLVFQVHHCSSYHQSNFLKRLFAEDGPYPKVEIPTQAQQFWSYKLFLLRSSNDIYSSVPVQRQSRKFAGDKAVEANT